jgi:hypothetical protein
VRRAGPRYRSHGPATVGSSAAYPASFALSVSIRGQKNGGVPKNPLPPHTTSFFFAVADAVAEADAMVMVYGEIGLRAARGWC